MRIHHMIAAKDHDDDTNDCQNCQVIRNST